MTRKLEFQAYKENVSLHLCARSNFLFSQATSGNNMSEKENLPQQSSLCVSHPLKPLLFSTLLYRLSSCNSYLGGSFFHVDHRLIAKVLCSLWML